MGILSGRPKSHDQKLQVANTAMALTTLFKMMRNNLSPDASDSIFPNADDNDILMNIILNRTASQLTSDEIAKVMAGVFNHPTTYEKLMVFILGITLLDHHEVALEEFPLKLDSLPYFNTALFSDVIDEVLLLEGFEPPY